MGNGMNKIIPGVYLGNFRDAKDEEQLNKNGITHILSIHDNAKELLKDKKYLCIVASDTPDQCLTQYFPECIDFIHRARLANGSVLIHCLAGVSRSVTVTAAYIMAVTNLGWRDTLNAIRGARNCANPNFGFQRQLMEYENTSLEVARKKMKKDYPSNKFSDQSDCDALLTSYRKFVLHGDSNNDDGLYSLPYNAYGNRTKVTEKSTTTSENSATATSNDVDSENASKDDNKAEISTNTDDDVGEAENKVRDDR